MIIDFKYGNETALQVTYKKINIHSYKIQMWEILF